MFKLDEMFRACNPTEPLSFSNPRERQSYIDFSSVRGFQIIEKMRKIISFSSDNTSCQLFTGQTGNGKSTELKRLKSILQEEDKFVVVYFDAAQEVDINNFDVGDLLLGIAHQIFKTLGNLEPPIQITPNRFQSLLEDIVIFLNSKITDLKFSIPGFGNVGFKSNGKENSLAIGLGEINLKAKLTPSIRNLLRDYTDPKIDIIISIINNEYLD